MGPEIVYLQPPEERLTFYSNSINSEEDTTGVECSSWNAYQAGLCFSCGTDGSKCAQLGPKAIEYAKFKNNKKSIKLYMKTDSKEPISVSDMW